MTTTIKTLRKRDGRDVAFDPKKIANAINKAFTATGFDVGSFDPNGHQCY